MTSQDQHTGWNYNKTQFCQRIPGYGYILWFYAAGTWYQHCIPTGEWLETT